MVWQKTLARSVTFHVIGLHLGQPVDGRELPEVFRERLFKPLGMLKSEPAITMDIRERIAKNYSRF